MFCYYLFYRASYTRASIGAGLGWFLVKLLIEVIYYGGRLCYVFLSYVSMFGQGRTSNPLVKRQTWRVVYIIEVTARFRNFHVESLLL